jgi:hypothetical protein
MGPTPAGHNMMIVLTYQTLTSEYKPQKDDQTLGSAVKTGWSLKTNAKHG